MEVAERSRNRYVSSDSKRSWLLILMNAQSDDEISDDDDAFEPPPPTARATRARR